MGYGLGVDLGTTSTAAAVAVGGGRPDTVPLGDRSADVPSAVFLREDGGELLGDAALRRGVAEPHRLAREFKRRLGDPTPLVLGGRPVSAETLTGHLLRWVVDEVRARQGGTAGRVVVTFPANWGPFRREMLAQAIAIADVGKVETVPEPVAAALHFASCERVPAGGAVAVYDLGGGTFDATVLRDAGRGYQVLGTPGGLEHLGGVDFDQAVFSHVTTALGESLTDLDADDDDVTRGLFRLREECTAAKEHLSSDTEATVHVELPGLRRDVRITRPEFEDLIRPSIEETVACLRRALRSADVEPDGLAAVVLVGGSVRIPLVTQMLGHDLGRPVTLSPSPKHAVALGAALVASGRASRSRAGPTPPQRERPPRETSPPVTSPPRTARPVTAPLVTAPPVAAPPGTSPPGTAPPAPGRPAPSGATARGQDEGGHRPSRATTRTPWLRALTAGLVATALLVALVVPLPLRPDPPAGSDDWRLQALPASADGLAPLRLLPPSTATPVPDTLDVDLVLAGTTVAKRRLRLSEGRADLDLSSVASPTALSWLGADLARWLAGPVRVEATAPAAGGCGTWSTLPCSEVVVDPTGDGFALELDGTEGGLVDAAGAGTGFTLVQPSSEGDSYRRDLLQVADGVLQVTTTPGIQYAGENSLDNALGVALPAPEAELRVSARLAGVPEGADEAEQAGLWLGTDEDNLVKLVVISRAGGRFNLHMQRESGGEADLPGQVNMPDTVTDTFAAGSDVRLTLVVDPAARTVAGDYTVGGGEPTRLATMGLPAGVLGGLDPGIEGAGTAAGVFTTQRNRPEGSPLVYSFDSFSVTGGGTAPDEGGSATAAAPGSATSTVPGSATAAAAGVGTVQALVDPPAPYRTVTFVLWVLLLLFVAAYTESLLRGVRRRRRTRTADVLGMSAVGALAGVALVLAGWMTSGLLAVEPARLLAAATVVLLAGAGAGVALLAGDRATRRSAPRR